MTDHKGETPQVSEWPGWDDVFMVRRYGYPGFPFPHQHCNSQALADAYVRKEEETAEVGPTETERYIPISRVKEKLNALAEDFDRRYLEAKAEAESGDVAGEYIAERERGIAFAFSAAAGDLYTLARSFPDTRGGE